MKKRTITLLSCLLLLLVCFASASWASEPISTDYTAAPSAKGAAAQYAASVTNKVNAHIYENRFIDHRVVPVEVPILMFHHISDEKGSALTSNSFRRYMTELAESDYETISYDELYSFVKGQGTLPEKPIIITFDDGYLSNYEYAYPILKGLGMKAEISVVGSTVGRDTHPETGSPIIPHFSWDQAREMVDSGLIKIHSHTYNMHQHASAQDVSRLGIIRNQNESDSLYSLLLSGDCTYMKQLIQKELGYDDPVFTYPYGKFNQLTEDILTNSKYKLTISIETGSNFVRIGDMDSLRGMKRIACDTNDSQSILERIEYYSK